MSAASEPVSLDGHNLTLQSLEAVARHRASARLAPEAVAAISRSSQEVVRLSRGAEAVYGVNTGYGAFADMRVAADEVDGLSRNLVLSHAVGVGEPFPPDVTRAAILVRANTLAIGRSGVALPVVEALLRLLEADLIPPIPSQGSLGSSGDLAPLAHLALAISAPDLVADSPAGWLGDERLPFAAGAARVSFPAVALGPKDGLALINGATFSASLLALACADLRRLLAAAEAAASLSFEALLGETAALDERLHAARPHPGQVRVAARMRELLAGSTLADSGGQVQDAYSLRCTPQVIGPAWEILEFAEAVVAREINSATDNPLFFSGSAISGGNFHGQPIGLASDYLKIAASEVGAISERRTFRLLSPHTNRDLPPMLVARPGRAGLESGLMMLQYTAAALALENQGLAAPASVRSLPTSADQEDHNANAAAAARDLARLLTNLETILAIELLVAAQALDIRMAHQAQARPGRGSAHILEQIRRHADRIEQDELMRPRLEALARLLRRDDWLPEAP